jgi:hypothetical protein
MGEKKDERNKEDVENLEVEALQDAELESVSGGDNNNIQSYAATSCCGGGGAT